MISMALNVTNEELDWGPLPRKNKDQFSELVSHQKFKFYYKHCKLQKSLYVNCNK